MPGDTNMGGAGGDMGGAGGDMGGAAGDFGGAIGGGGTGCFIEGTLVSTDRGLRAIESIEVADQVESFDFGMGKPVMNSVLVVHRARRSVLLAIDFGGEIIRCTPTHRFYSDGWREACDLKPRDTVLIKGGDRREVQSVTKVLGTVPVYNLAVHRHRNFVVGTSAVVVHNDKVEGGGDFTNPDDALG
jgi:hypothetical protein